MACIAAIAASKFLNRPSGPTEPATNGEQLVQPANESPLVFEPDSIDMGEIAPLSITELTVAVRNVSNQSVQISDVISDCGCALPVWSSQPIGPGESSNIQLTVEGPSQQGLKLSKRVTVLVDGARPVHLALLGHVGEFVRANPAEIDAPPSELEGGADGVEFISLDGTPITIDLVSPSVSKTLDATPSAKPVLHIDWKAWRAAGSPMKLEVLTSHPKAGPLSIIVRRPKA